MNQRFILLSRFKIRLFIPVIAVMILTACNSGESGKKKTETTPTDPPVTQVFSLKKGRLSSSLQIPGELIA